MRSRTADQLVAFVEDVRSLTLRSDVPVRISPPWECFVHCPRGIAHQTTSFSPRVVLFLRQIPRRKKRRWYTAPLDMSTNACMPGLPNLSCFETSGVIDNLTSNRRFGDSELTQFSERTIWRTRLFPRGYLLACRFARPLLIWSDEAHPQTAMPRVKLS